MVEDLIIILPSAERKLVNLLRSTIMHTAPMLREKLSYGVPYYFMKTRICFIWPASIPGSGINEGVALGFCKGYQMSNEEGLLRADGRKQVLVITFTSPSQINLQLVKQWVHEAILIDQKV